MTKWTVTIFAETSADDSKVMKVLLAAGRTGLKYKVRNDEVAALKVGKDTEREAPDA